MKKVGVGDEAKLFPSLSGKGIVSKTKKGKGLAETA